MSEGLIGVIIGAIAAVLGAVAASYFQYRFEINSRYIERRQDLYLKIIHWINIPPGIIKEATGEEDDLDPDSHPPEWMVKFPDLYSDNMDELTLYASPKVMNMLDRMYRAFLTYATTQGQLNQDPDSTQEAGKIIKKNREELISQIRKELKIKF